MPDADSRVRELTTTITKVDILSMLRQGYSPTEIVERTGQPPEIVRKVIDDALLLYTERVQEHSEKVRALNMMRLERLYRAAEPHAIGDDEAPADRHWIRTALEIIKAQNDMVDRAERAHVDTDSKKGGVINADNINVTMLSGSDLYTVAQAAMEAHRLSEQEGTLWADSGVDELMMMNLEDGESLPGLSEEAPEIPDFDPTVAALAQRVDSLSARLGEEDEDDDTDK
jgi:hypothetical protein